MAALLVFLLAACATTNTTPAHPNQINAFDGAAYDTLITVQASLNQAKTLIGSYPQYKTDLNIALLAYNEAIAVYEVYHVSVATAQTTAALQAQLAALVTQTSALLKNLGVKV